MSFIKFANILFYNCLSLPVTLIGTEGNNTTGYHDPIMHMDFGMERTLFIDSVGRRGIIIPLAPGNNVVVFQRYTNNNRIFVTNGLDCAFPSAIQSEHQWQMLLDLIETRKIRSISVRNYFGDDKLFCSVTPDSIAFYSGMVERRLAEVNALA